MKIIAHRGGAGLAPENGLAAIQAGLDAGADGIEFDIRVTSDGVPVLNHNRSFSKEGVPYKIADLTYTDLKQHNPDLATLPEVLKLIGSRAMPFIEVKGGEPVGPVVSALDDFIGTTYRPAELMLGSKNQKTLRALHRALPDVPKVVIEPWSGVRASWRARQVETKHIAMRSWWLWSGFLRGMQRRGYLVAAYTMNDPVKVAKWRPYLDAVVTDYPDRFQAPSDVPGDS